MTSYSFVPRLLCGGEQKRTSLPTYESLGTRLDYLVKMGLCGCDELCRGPDSV